MLPQPSTLLYIEPDKAIQDYYSHLIETILEKSYQLKIVETAHAGLQYLKQASAHNEEVPLIITAYYLPDMRCDTLLRHLYAINPQMLQIIIVEQLSAEALIHLINYANPFHILTHPYTFQKLKLIVEQAIFLYQQNRKKELFYITLENIIAEHTQKLKDTNQRLQQEIKERQVIAESLRQSQQKLAFHIQKTPLAYIEWDRQLCVQAWNQSAEMIFGYSQQEALHKTAFELILPPDLKQYIDTVWSELINEKNSFSNTNQNITKTGELIYCEWYNTPLLNDAGEVIGVASLAQDITSRHTMLEALRNSESRLSTVIDKNPVGISILDEQGIVEFVNAAYLKIYQCQREDILGKHFTDFFPVSDQQYLSALYASLLEQQVQVSNQELHLLNHESQWVTVLLDMVLFEAQDGCSKVITFTVNITKRKRAEEALRYNEANMRHYFEQPLIGIEKVDAQGKIINVNSRFCEMLGYEANELLNMTWQQLTHPKDLPYAKQFFAQLVASNIESYNIDKRYICKNGNAIYTNIAVYSVKLDEQRDVMHYIAMVQDISERKQAEENLQQAWAKAEAAQQEAEQANRAKSRFLANMSHELRTPLNAILGHTQLLQRNDHLTEPQQQSVYVMHRNAEYLLSLINDMLDLSKIEVDSLELKPNYFNLRQMLNELCDLFKERAQQKNISFICQLSDELPETVEADEKRLRQILINLLGNAIKFTQHGWVKLAVSSHCRTHSAAAQQLQFQIEDSGVGIEDKDLQRIFLPFQQADNQQAQTEGTGLGLAIVHKLVKMMGGQLQVSSIPNQGSIFWLTLKLPYLKDLLSISKPHQTERIVGYLRSPKRSPYRILIVDDRVENRQILVRMLGELGFALSEADNGQLALEVAARWQPDAILMDAIMPVMDGLTAVRQLRADPQLSQIYIVMISAGAFAQDKNNSLQAGCNAFLPKPVKLDTLLETLKVGLQLTWITQTHTKATNKALPVLPYHLEQEQVEILHNHVLCGDINAIIEFAKNLHQDNPEQKSFCQHLTYLAKQFDIAKIRQLLTQIMDHNQ